MVSRGCGRGRPCSTIHRAGGGALGATILEPPVLRADGRFSFQILADPVGTEFCICAEEE